MPNFFYIDTTGTKQGPVNDQQLKALAANGVIMPQTPLETESGHKGVAGQIPGLFASPTPANPFAAATPHLTQMPMSQYGPTSHSRKPFAIYVVYGLLAVATLFLLCGGFSHYREADTKASVEMYASGRGGKLYVGPGQYVTGADACHELLCIQANWNFAKYCWLFFSLASYGGAGAVFAFSVNRKQE